MSADYWSSSQRTKWQLTKPQILEARRKVLLLERKMVQNGLIKDHPEIQYDYNMRIYLHNLLIKLGRRLNIRQVALASAEIYLIRFLTRVSLKEINVYLLVTTCVYVACKVEECPQHIRLILSEARNLWPEYIPQDITKLAEFEFYLIEEMDSYLFLHHPYKSLIQIRDFLTENVSIYGFQLTDDELQNAWSLINDTYMTDLHLFLPPHIIGIAAIYITIVLKKNLAELRGSTDKDTNAGSMNQNSNENTEMTDANGTNKTNDQNSSQPSNKHNLHIDDLMTLVNPGNMTNNSSTNGNLDNLNMSKTKDQVNLDANFSGPKLDEETIKINKFMNFLSQSHINLDEVVEAMQDMINLYVVWNRYNETGVKKALQSMLLSR
jgi:cyclin C